MTCSRRPRNLWPDLTLTPGEKSPGVFLCLASPLAEWLASPRLASPCRSRSGSHHQLPEQHGARSPEPRRPRGHARYTPRIIAQVASPVLRSARSTERAGHAVTRSRGRAHYTPRIITQGQVAASPTRLDQPLRITSSQISTERLGLGLGICFRRYTGRITSKSTKKRAKVLKCSITKSTLEQFNPLIIKHTS